MLDSTFHTNTQQQKTYYTECPFLASRSTAVVMGCPGGCRLLMRCICRDQRHDKRDILYMRVCISFSDFWV